MLTVTQCENLFSMLNGVNLGWKASALDGCLALGLVSRDGSELTPDGRRKAERVRDIVDGLAAGIPLDQKRRCQITTIEREQWLTGNVCDGPAWFNGRAVFWTKPLIDVTTTEADEECIKAYQWEIRPTLKAKGLVKVEPYAYQQNGLRGTGMVCLREANRARSSAPIIRIPARYYDVLATKEHELTYWYLPDREASPIVVRNPRHRIIALVNQTPIPGWPEPSGR